MKRIFLLVLAIVLVLSVMQSGMLGITVNAKRIGDCSYSISNGEATIESCYTSATGDLTIPSTIEGYPVTSIGSGAFYVCKNLTSVTIPDGVTSIGSHAFYECTSLTDVSIPDSVTSIATNAFAGCTALQYNVRSGISYLGNTENPYVFLAGAYDSITACKIPNTTKVIGYHAFSYCKSLTSVTIPDGVTSIGERAFFNCTNLTSVMLPDSVISIGDCAFANCTNLTSVTIPDSVSNIGELAFGSCTSLEYHRWENGKYIGNAANPYVALVEVLSNSTSIEIHESTKVICDSLFYNHTNLTNVTIPDGVVSIGNSAFKGCTSLAVVSIGDGVTSIGGSAFYGCTNLTSVTIPDSVTSIGNGAFERCTSLTSVTIPDSVSSIGRLSFCGCTDLTSVTIGDGVTSVDYGVFSGCTSLTSVTIPGSVVSIGSHSFYECTSLTSVTIPNGVTSIDQYAFYGCTSLISVTIPSSVVSIGNNAFSGCDGLTTVVIGESVTDIKGYAFDNCVKLKHVWYCGSIYNRSDIVIASGNTYLEKATWHYNYCGSEKHSYDSACDNDCNTCGYERTVPDHVYTNSCDSDCDECGTIRSVNHTYNHGCDTDCNDCGAVRSVTHTYDHGCDAICNICSYERTVSDHVYANSCDTTCNECGAVRSITHTYDYICDNTCNICGYKRNTSHIYDDADDVTCNECKQTLAPAAPALESVTDNTVTLVAVVGYEYSKNGTTWQKSNVFTGLQPNYSYRFYQRVAETKDNLASPASSSLSVKTDKYKPSIPEDFTFLEITDTSVTLNAVTDCEYSMDGRSWQKNSVFTGLIPGTQYTFYQRIAEGSINYASDYAVLYITTYSKLGTIIYDPNGGTGAPGTTTGKIPAQTPKRSGYEFIGWALTPNTYAVYKPGDSYSYEEDIILYAVWVKLCDNCGGDGEYFLKCSRCAGTGLGSTESCSHCGGKGYVETKVTCPAGCYNGKLITGDGRVYSCGVCKGDGIYEEPSGCGNCGGAGNLTYACKDCSGQGGWWFTCSQCVYGIPKFTPEAPQAPKLQSISNNTVVLAGYSTCEYSMDGRTWQDSNVFSNLNANTQYVFYQRYKATTYTNHSNVSLSFTVRTLKEHLLPPQPPVLQSKTFSQVILEKTAGCEYSIDGINWQSDNVFADLLPSTSYTFYCRFAETSTHMHSYASDGLTVVTEELPSYKVVFLDWDGTVLSTKTYWHGDEVIAPSDPTKVADNVYCYTFVGWDKEIVNCIDNVTYTAIYSPVYIDYTVVFQNWDGSILSTQTYHYGENVIVPGDPAKAADNVYSYTFSGWDKEVLNCTGHATYTATYTSVYNEYVVVFKDWNGTVLSSTTYHWGDEIVVPKDLTREKDEQYEYIFDCWDNEVVNCAGDADYTAVYTAKPLVPTAITSNKYTISGSMISKVGVGTSVSTFVSNLNESKFAKVYQGTTEATSSTLIGTGMELKLTDGNIVGATATVVVTGDTNGDGKITITDMLAVKAHLLKKSELEGAAALAGDTSGDANISITDFIQLKAHILGKEEVKPQSTKTAVVVQPAAYTEDVDTTAVVVDTTETPAANIYYLTTDALVPDKRKVFVV